MRPTLTHLALHVSDLDACIVFYQRFCGMQVIHERLGKGRRIVWMAEPGKEHQFIFVIMPGGQDRNLAANDYSHFGFALSSRKDVDRIAALAEQTGCLIWPPRDEPYPAGYYCGTTDLHGQNSVGHAHLLRSGRLAFRDKRGQLTELAEPSLILAVRPQEHHLLASEADAAELVCATLQFDGGANNPLPLALPDFIIKPLRELQGLDGTLDWLFDEAFGAECGRDVILNRLFELMVIQLLRHLLASRSIDSGMMAGLASPQLSRALVIIHNEPQRNWSVAELANRSGMSRASFAAHFRKTVGVTPADYLANWRISLTQKRMREGRPMALIADEVGYESPSALARTFRRKVGASPREWLQQNTA